MLDIDQWRFRNLDKKNIFRMGARPMGARVKLDDKEALYSALEKSSSTALKGLLPMIGIF